jgi:hypothetical protein
MNRLVWDLRHEDIIRVPGTFLAADYFGTVPGYRVPPGAYRVRLSHGDRSLTETLEVLKDPRVETSPDDFGRQAELLASIRESINEIHSSITVMLGVREQVTKLVGLTRGSEGAEAIAESGTRLAEKISEWQERLIQTKLQTIMDAVNFPTRLNEQFLYLKGAVASADTRPTDAQMERYQELQEEWLRLKEEMSRLLDEDLAAFNALFRDRDVPAVVVPPFRSGRRDS